jgi:hypothetical protein
MAKRVDSGSKGNNKPKLDDDIGKLNLQWMPSTTTTTTT